MQLIFAGKVLGVLLRVALALVPAAVLRVWGLYLTLAHGLDTQSGYRVLLMLLLRAKATPRQIVKTFAAFG